MPSPGVSQRVQATWSASRQQARPEAVCLRAGPVLHGFRLRCLKAEPVCGLCGEAAAVAFKEAADATEGFF